MLLNAPNYNRAIRGHGHFGPIRVMEVFYAQPDNRYCSPRGCPQFEYGGHHGVGDARNWIGGGRKACDRDYSGRSVGLWTLPVLVAPRPILGISVLEKALLGLQMGLATIPAAVLGLSPLLLVIASIQARGVMTRQASSST